MAANKTLHLVALGRIGGSVKSSTEAVSRAPTVSRVGSPRKEKYVVKSAVHGPYIAAIL